jgi:hypothetical protein
MNRSIRKGKTNQAFSWRKTARNVLYFGVPITVALASVIFPLSSFLRQAMVGFMLIWFVAGSWLFASPN